MQYKTILNSSASLILTRYGYLLKIPGWIKLSFSRCLYLLFPGLAYFVLIAFFNLS